MSINQTTPRKPFARTRVTNGVALLPEVDGRSMWARRVRDVLALHVQDLGGASAVTEGQLSLCRRAAVLTVELETLEQTFATDGAASQRGLDLYTRTTGHLHRLLSTLGLKRKEVKPLTIQGHLANKRAGA